MLTSAILVVLTPFLAAGVMFVLEVVVGLPGNTNFRDNTPQYRATLVIPAHDEEKGLAETIGSLRDALPSGWKLLLVADNCSDLTAQIARDRGAEVIERSDDLHRGKGFALAFARDHLQKDAPDVVIVIDADCSIDGSSLQALGGQAFSGQCAAQAIYLMSPDPQASPKVQISCFAFLIKNLIRQRGLQRLAGGVHLTGTGMALPWSMFAQADLATASIIEDARLGIQLSLSGTQPQLVPNATVWSAHAAQDHTLKQRSRWEGGMLALAREMFPALLVNAARTGSFRLAMKAFDLLIPPLALLISLYVALIALLVPLTSFGWVGSAPLSVLLLITGIVGAAVLAAWLKEGRNFVSASTLARIPGYILWKIPMYLKILVAGPPETWERTDR